MQRAARFAERIARRRPFLIPTALAVVTLLVDFATGREIRFPLLYVLPIGLAAWTGQRTLAYALSVLLPLVRVVFEDLWRAPALFPLEGTNAFIEVCALALYVHLVGRKGVQTRVMESTIAAQGEEMQHLRAFTRMVGTTLRGRGVSPGLADGVALVLSPEHAPDEQGISREEVEQEVKRFDGALAAAAAELESTRRQFDHPGAGEELALVDMHLGMLRDAFFAQKCRARISEGLVGAEHAVLAEVGEMEQRLRGLKQEFLRERSADVCDIGRRIVRQLGLPSKGTPNPLAALQPGTIVVAEELLLSDMLQMDAVNVAGIVTERTGPASHVAILARARRIPAVCDIRDVTSLLASGDQLLVDAEEGTVTAVPTQTQAARFAARKAQSDLLTTAAMQPPAERCTTKDGVPIGLHGNIGRPDEVVIVLENRLDGVGLFRSEFLFLNAERPPDLEAQHAAYSEVATMLHPRPVVIRTMDLGGDKIPLFHRTANDMALRMGLRGLAYSLTEMTMFRTQIRAILRAAQGGNVRILFPMVMGAADFNEARRIVDEVLRGEHVGKRPPVGAMIETPAAVFDVREILKLADFVCIGTNDLAHSILAMSRGSQGHSSVLSFLHPSVLGAMGQVLQAAKKQGVPVSVCGEAASDPAVACLLVGLGVRELSMSPFLSARVRSALRQLTLDEAQVLARRALGAPTPHDVSEILASALPDLVVPPGGAEG